MIEIATLQFPFAAIRLRDLPITRSHQSLRKGVFPESFFNREHPD